jgi:hypothetical protein
VNFFTKKVGPLPIWAWGGLAAGGTFLILKGGGKKTAADPGAPQGTTSGGTQPRNDAGNYNATITETQTFGGGTLGFIGRPLQGFGNVFVNLHHHPEHDGWFHGGRRYDSHAFGHHGFGEGGRHHGGPHGGDRGHGGFAGGRNGPPKRGGRKGGNGDVRGRIARSFAPNSSRYTDNNQSSRGDVANPYAGGQGVKGAQR